MLLATGYLCPVLLHASTCFLCHDILHVVGETSSAIPVPGVSTSIASTQFVEAPILASRISARSGAKVIQPGSEWTSLSQPEMRERGASWGKKWSGRAS
jgi:hypothetical protein